MSRRPEHHLFWCDVKPNADMTATEASPLVASADASSETRRTRAVILTMGAAYAASCAKVFVDRALDSTEAQVAEVTSNPPASARCQARARAFTRSARCSQCYSSTSSAASCRSSHRQPPASPRRSYSPSAPPRPSSSRGCPSGSSARACHSFTPFFIFSSFRLTVPRSPSYTDGSGPLRCSSLSPGWTPPITG